MQHLGTGKDVIEAILLCPELMHWMDCQSAFWLYGVYLVDLVECFADVPSKGNCRSLK